MHCRAVGGKCQVASLCSSGAVMVDVGDQDDQDDQKGSGSEGRTCELHVDMRNGRVRWSERGRR
jgi:hypothetical protein